MKIKKMALILAILLAMAAVGCNDDGKNNNASSLSDNQPDAVVASGEKNVPVANLGLSGQFDQTITITSTDDVFFQSVECVRALERNTGEVLGEFVWDRVAAGFRPLLIPAGVRSVQLVLDAEASEYFDPGTATLTISSGTISVAVVVEFATANVVAMRSGNKIRLENSGPDTGWVSELRFFVGSELDGAVVELYIDNIYSYDNFYVVEKGVVICDDFLWEEIAPGGAISFQIKTRANEFGVEPAKMPAVLLSAKIFDSGFHQIYAQGCPLEVNLFAH